jgi:hypothetical protein
VSALVLSKKGSKLCAGLLESSKNCCSSCSSASVRPLPVLLQLLNLRSSSRAPGLLTNSLSAKADPYCGGAESSAAHRNE